MTICHFLANRSGGKIPGRFAKIARTLKNQYFHLFICLCKMVGEEFLLSNLDASIEVRQNDVPNPFTTDLLQPAVANLKSRSPGLKQLIQGECDEDEDEESQT